MPNHRSVSPRSGPSGITSTAVGPRAARYRRGIAIWLSVLTLLFTVSTPVLAVGSPIATPLVTSSSQGAGWETHDLSNDASMANIAFKIINSTFYGQGGTRAKASLSL